MTFTVAAPTLWNSLPEELRNVYELGSFKRQLKTVPFNTAYKCDT